MKIPFIIIGIMLLAIGAIMEASAQSSNNTLIESSHDTIDKYNKLILIARLHGNLTNDFFHKTYAKMDVLTCVNLLIGPHDSSTVGYTDTCDPQVTDAITSHLLTDNQTISNMAKAYLKQEDYCNQVNRNEQNISGHNRVHMPCCFACYVSPHDSLRTDRDKLDKVIYFKQNVWRLLC
jgi:hypothetical protein